jgi:cell division protein FtsW (lipid II flippase)
MWVVAMLFPFAILIRSPARLTSFSTWALIMTAGAWASGSRAILASCAIAIAGSLWVYRRRISLAVAPAVIVLVMLLAEDAQKLRIFQLAGEFDEVNPRGEQLRSLLSMFESNQLFGAGLGAVAESIRSERAEYSYELTYVALLAKVGLIGAVAATAVATLGFSRVFRMRPQARFMAGIATLMFVLETGSNPYLLNLFGMYLLVVLLCVSRDPGLFGRPRRHLTVADDPHIELRASKDAVVPAQLH